jgi:hypothetical protein
MELKTKELIDLDKKIYDLNQIYGLVLFSINEVPNISAINDITSKIESIKEELSSVKTDDEFETMFIENHLLNLENQRIYLQYASTRDKENVNEIIKIFYGDETLAVLQKKLKSFDYDADWDHYLSYQNYSYRAYPADSPELQPRFKKILEDLKEDILEYARKHHGLSKEYNFDLVLGQPYSNQSSFRPSTKRVEISPGTFYAYKEGDKINVNVSLTIQTLFHEFIGHALQEYNSTNMPKSLKDDSINTSVPTMSLHAEGFAQLTGKMAIEFMKEYKDKYHIKDDYIRQRESGLKRLDIGVFWNYFQYLKLKNLEDDKFDYKDEFMKVSKNFGALTNYELSTQSPFTFFKNVCYIIGLDRMEKLYSELTKEFGEENEAIINKALNTGLFNIKILPKFTRYYIKQNLKKK